MATVGQVLHSFDRNCRGVAPDPILAQEWLQQRYASVLERCDWPFLIAETTFNTVAEITAGTVTVTLGSATVTETTSNANGWSSAVQTRYFRVDGRNEFYLINTFNDLNPDTLTLARVYEGDTATLAGYSIVQRFYTPATDAREIISISSLETPGFLRKVSKTDLEHVFMERSELGVPTVWAPAGRDTSNDLRVELYPTPDEAHGYLVHYLIETPSLANASTTILPQVNTRMLIDGMLADYWIWRSGMNDAKGNEAALSSQFEQKFEKQLLEMIARETPNWPASYLRPSNRVLSTRYRRRDKFGVDHSWQFPDA